MIEKLYELETYKHENIKVFYDTENEQLFSVRNDDKKIYFKTDDAITIINHYEVKSVVITHYFTSMCYDELERRYNNKELAKNELFLWNVIQGRNFLIKSLKKDLRDELKSFMESFKNSVDYDVLVDGIVVHEHLTLAKLFHKYCIQDSLFSYELIKKVYDIAFLNHYNSIYSKTFYDFLIEKVYEYDMVYNPFDWGVIITFFKRIVEEEGDSTNA